MIETSGLDIPQASACAFCDYLNGRRPFTILEVGDLAAILVTREQRGVGHVLVLPRCHRESILDLTSAEASALMDAVIRVSHAIDKSYGRPGIAVWQNNGIAAHQTIPHVHFHVAGTNEGGGTEFGPVPEIDLVETEAIAEQLRRFLDRDVGQ